MKATLNFDLGDMEDKEMFDLHNQARGMWHVLYDLDEWLHRELDKCDTNIEKSLMIEARRLTLEDVMTELLLSFNNNRVDLNVLS
jgi:hypothetical protein